MVGIGVSVAAGLAACVGVGCGVAVGAVAVAVVVGRATGASPSHAKSSEAAATVAAATSRPPSLDASRRSECGVVRIGGLLIRCGPDDAPHKEAPSIGRGFFALFAVSVKR
jgi:hypothetical protein